MPHSNLLATPVVVKDTLNPSHLLTIEDQIHSFVPSDKEYQGSLFSDTFSLIDGACSNVKYKNI